MSNIPPLFTKTKETLKAAFMGSKTLDADSRKIFKNDILLRSVSRTKVLLVIIFLIQISNAVVQFTTDAHAGYENIFITAIGLLMLDSVLFFFVFTFFKRFHKSSYAFLSLCHRLCWISMLCISCLFSYGDYFETGSMNNFTTMVLALGIIPVFSLPEKFIYTIIFSCANFFMASSAGMAVFARQQMVVLALLSAYVSVSQYSYSINMFRERAKLKDANFDLTRLSQTDPLTGLLNRRGIEEQMGHMLEASKRKGDAVLIFMMDIDYFKAYNDTYLHIKGDECLAAIAACLKKNANRATDIVARFGGEEFAIMATNMSRDEVVPFALKLKNSVEELHIPFGIPGFPFVTISIGCALVEINHSAKNKEQFTSDLIKAADKELYNAKNNGRNRVSFNGILYL